MYSDLKGTSDLYLPSILGATRQAVCPYRPTLYLLTALIDMLILLRHSQAMLFTCERRYRSFPVSSLLRADVHPDKQRCPNRHGDADRDHSPHTSREIWRKVCPIEYYTPPRINCVASHIHRSDDDGSQTVLFISKHVVGPCKKGGLTRVYTPSPVVHCKMNGRVLWIR